MKKILSICLAMLICEGSMASDNLIINNVTIPKNGDVAVNVDFHFDEADGYAAFGFELELPEGVSIVKGADGNNLITISETACAGMLAGKTSDPKFGIYTMDNLNWIRGTEGTLMTFYLNADSELEVGTRLTVTVNNAYLGPRPTLENPIPESVRLSSFTFTITIGEPADSRTTLNEDSISAPKASDGAVDVRVKRTIKANQWSTICLPFSMTEAQMKEAFGNDVELADFVGCDVTYADETEENVQSISVKFESASAIEANHPYIIKVSADIAEFTVDGVVISPDDASVDRDEKRVKVGSKWYTFYNSFIGTYVAQTELAANTLFLNSNKFYYSAGATKMKAFRAYFDFYDVLTTGNESNEVKMAFIDGISTQINGVTNSKSGVDNSIYDLSGRKVNRLEHNGVYIINGQKVIKK